MPRILGVDIPGEKRIEYALRYIYGIGPSRAQIVIDEAQFPVGMRAKELNDQQINLIVQIIENHGFLIEGDLRREFQGNLKRLQAINCYRGQRHKKGLPVRGQRTSTNSRTRKGPKRTVGVVRNKNAKAGKV
ncbi:MAG: 30S ribosomal protein S13 [Verrucomicrobiota bacterium]